LGHGQPLLAFPYNLRLPRQFPRALAIRLELSRLTDGAAQPTAEPNEEEIPNNKYAHADPIGTSGNCETANGFGPKEGNSQT
jgi:hypothetical protein